LRTILDYIRDGWGYIVAFFALLGLIAWVLLYIGAPVGGDARPVLVTVPKGATSWALGQVLVEKRLVRSALGFSLVARLTGDSRKLKAGVYSFNRSMSVHQMIDIMVEGKISAAVVVIPEGFTIRQIADRLAAKAHVNRQQFLNLAATQASTFSDAENVPSSSLEGYLFPATYTIGFGEDARAVIQQMLRVFRANVDREHAAAPERLHRILTVASMVEREAKLAKDRPLISAVIWNRQRQGMKLDIDATVEYALGEHRARLYYRDLDVDSPYNTYRRAGLPPGPIANPGLSSIDAAMHPAKVGYLYYVAKPDGSHIFSDTLSQHNAAKQRVKAMRSASGNAALAHPTPDGSAA
jgi:UPF0755 protein